MADPANGIVECLAGRKRLMTTLVGQDPQTGAKETLDECVQSPKTYSYGRERDIPGCEISVGEIECCG